MFITFFFQTLKSFTLLDIDQNHYDWGWTWIKIPLCPNLEVGCWGVKIEKFAFSSNQSVKNQKLYNISKNQPTLNQWRGELWGGVSLFDLEKVLFLSYLPSKLSYELKIWYVHLVGVVDVHFEGLDFSRPISPHLSLKEVVFWSVFLIFLIFEFVARINPFKLS